MANLQKRKKKKLLEVSVEELDDLVKFHQGNLAEQYEVLVNVFLYVNINETLKVLYTRCM